jgi:hypothetical protein
MAFFRDDISQMHALLFAGQTNQASITSGRLVREQHDKVMRFLGHLTKYPDWAQPGWRTRMGKRIATCLQPANAAEPLFCTVASRVLTVGP